MANNDSDSIWDSAVDIAEGNKSPIINHETLLEDIWSGTVSIDSLDRDTFKQLLQTLQQVFFVRVLNCIDGTGRYDKEWMALSGIFARVLKQMAAEDKEGKDA